MENIGSNIAPYLEQVMTNIENKNSFSITLGTFLEKIFETVKNFFNLPSMDTLKNIDYSNIKNIIATIGITVIILIIVCIIMYILKAVGLYVMAKRSNKEYGWIAFIPYGCFFVIGKIIGKTRIFGIDIERPEFCLPLIMLSSLLPYTGILTIPLFVLFMYGLLYRLYQQKISNFSVVLLILSIIVPIFIPFFIFAIRKKNS